MTMAVDFSWLDRVPQTVEKRFGPATRKVLAALRRLREKEGGSGS